MTTIQLARLVERCDPFRAWNGSAIRMCEVCRARVSRCLKTLVWSDVGTDRLDWYPHASRIAWLVENPDWDPIQLDVGVPELGAHVDWWIEDGNHRCAAALCAGRETIDAEVSGSVDYAEQMLA
jgi:hypothetical protein